MSKRKMKNNDEEEEEEKKEKKEEALIKKIDDQEKSIISCLNSKIECQNIDDAIKNNFSFSIIFV